MTTTQDFMRAHILVLTEKLKNPNLKTSARLFIWQERLWWEDQLTMLQSRVGT